jgi:molybdopterin synthase sulfur carrier subunit
MEVHYTAWLRNKAGKARETIDPPQDVKTLAGLVDWLCGTGAEYQSLFSYRSIINASVNGSVVQDWNSQPVSRDDKIIFFSPMAGG